MRKKVKLVTRITLRAIALIGAALLMGIAFNSINPNGIPLITKKARHEAPSEPQPATSPEAESKPVIENKTEAVSLIRGGSEKKNEPAR